MSFDPGARGLAAQAHNAAAALAIRNLGNVGVRIFSGRINNPKAIASGVAAGRTYEVTATAAVPFDAVRMVLAVGNTDAANAIAVTGHGSVAAVPNPNDGAIASAAWQVATFGGANALGGASTVALNPAATSARRAHYVSDVIPVASVPRDDGGTHPMLRMRLYVNQTTGSTGNIVVLGNNSQSFANWASHPSGRIWRMVSKGGQFSQTNYAGMTEATGVAAENGCPIVGLIYYARGKVVNVVGFGDSITEGQGTYVGEGFGFPACEALSRNGQGVAFEWSDMGWSGMALAAIRQHMFDALSAGLKWDIAVLPGGSPNDIGGGSGYVGSISGTTLTVTTAGSANLAINGPNIAAGTRIAALGTGTGGNGTYSVDTSQTAASSSLVNARPITAADIAATRFKASQMIDLAKGAGMVPILWTWLPTNSSAKPYGVTDSLRRGLNADYRNWASRGCIVADFDAALAGTADATGQVQMLAGTTSDNIHPNDAGSAALAAILTKAGKWLVRAPSGLMVT